MVVLDGGAGWWCWVVMLVAVVSGDRIDARPLRRTGFAAQGLSGKH
jgi:hypothetical protein